MVMKLTPKMLACVCLITGLTVAFGVAAKKPADEGPDEWFMKTRLQVTDPFGGSEWADGSSGVFGKLAASSDGYDRHDIPVFASAVNSPAALVFVRGADWGEHEGEYLSSYHSADGKLDVWPFTVFSSVEGAEVTLTWDGLFELTPYQDGALTRYVENETLDSKILNKLKLVDLETGEVTEALAGKGKKNRELNEYTFSLNSGETNRHFMWVLGDPDTTSAPSTALVESYLAKQQDALDRQIQMMEPARIGPPVDGDPFADAPSEK
jgi:hypothetical protein